MSRAAGSPAAPGSFYFHATLREFLPSIAAEGLLPHPSDEAGEPVVYVEDGEGEAENYLEADGVMLRVRLDGTLLADSRTAEYLLYDPVPPESLEVRVGARWVPVQAVVRGMGGEVRP